MAVTITARCHPALAPLLPPPVPASGVLPDWLRAMPGKVAAASLGGAEVRTLKHCAPFLDALGLGVVIPLVTDLTVRDGEVSWDWDPPPLPDAAITRAPVGIHVPEQAEGAPLGEGEIFVKFVNYWTLSVPEGWSLLFTHPLNRPDLPFLTLDGVVDCDAFADGYVHFPARLRPGFEGVIPRGTPVAQVIPVQKGTGLEIGSMTAAQVTRNRTLQEALQAEPGVYRRVHRRKGTGAPET